MEQQELLMVLLPAVEEVVLVGLGVLALLELVIQAVLVVGQVLAHQAIQTSLGQQQEHATAH